MIKAYEIQGCLALENAFNRVGLDHVILVKVATTAATAQMLGLGRAQIIDARSQAWIDGHPLGHRRRLAKALPALTEKFRKNLDHAFAAPQAERILALCPDAKQLSATPLHTFVDMMAA